MSTVDADEPFLCLVVEQENTRGSMLPIDSLIVLATLHEQKRLGVDELALHIQRDAAQAKRTVEQLVEAGLVEVRGSSRNRSYMLSVAVYQAKGEEVAYTRQAGFNRLQHEQMVLGHIRHHGRIRRTEVMELCHLSPDQASSLLKRLKAEGRLQQHGERRWAYYTLTAPFEDL